MPTHDIIDNRKEKLVDHICRILSSTEVARFAVGYFYLSGLEAIADRLDGVKELYLLIGNTTNRETLEQLVEGYQNLDSVREIADAQTYPKRTEALRMAVETAKNIRTAVEQMDQTDAGERLVKILVQMIIERRLKVRVYTKGRLHAKAYIFDYGQVFDEAGKSLERHERGIAIVGSSNLTLSGVTHNTELNVVVQGNDNHAELSVWFDELWQNSEDFDQTLMQEMQQSWAIQPVRPYDIYMKTLYTLVKDRLENKEEQDALWENEITETLADFQKVAVRQAIQIIHDYGGAFVSDVVGLGKSYIGTAIVKHFERTERARPLIICPAPLVEMWDRYNEVYQLHARVLSMGYLQESQGGDNFLLNDVKYRDRDFVLLDESHNLRHPNTQRYKMLQAFLATGKRCCFLTATPRSKSAWDVYNQIKLFHQDDKTDLPIDPPNLRNYFLLVEKGNRKLPDLLSNILVRRTRNHILRWYGFDASTHQPLDPSEFNEYLEGQRQAYVIVAGKPQFFPRRKLATIEYSIEDTYQGLYQQLRRYLGASHRGQHSQAHTDELTYARYGLWHYVVKQKQRIEPYSNLQRAGANLRGLMRVLLFKRFESSVYAFRESARRILKVHESFLSMLDQGIVPAGQEAQQILYESTQVEETDLINALLPFSRRYKAADFDMALLRKHIIHDISVFHKILTLVEPISPDRDAKLQTLKKHLEEVPLKEGKRLIFTQYADTARYLYENINPGKLRDDMDVIHSGDKSKTRAVGRFAPKANPEYVFQPGESELSTLIATDVLAEGLNLQDCDKMINYDLHWNPVQLIQRFGRIDRIGSEHDVIYAFNFLPETALDHNLGLREKLHNRIQEIHDTIGEDSAILDSSEQLNVGAMYAIYEQKSGQLSLFEEEEKETLDLNEAEEIMRQLRRDNEEEFERIANLRDGIRTGRYAGYRGMYVLCQAGRYQQLFLLDETGYIASRDTAQILSTIKCGQELQGLLLPEGYNKRVMNIKRRFTQEVQQRWIEQEHTVSLGQGQRYVLRELRLLFGITENEEIKLQINLLEKAFRGSITVALNRELNLFRRNGVTGQDLLKRLVEIYYQHNMKDWQDRRATHLEEHPTPKIICSELLM